MPQVVEAEILDARCLAYLESCFVQRAPGRGGVQEPFLLCRIEGAGAAIRFRHDAVERHGRRADSLGAGEVEHSAERGEFVCYRPVLDRDLRPFPAAYQRFPSPLLHIGKKVGA